ncbi:MAG: thymidine phosphorylase [Candidatus Angelobacter sp.]|jgi:pyrimidine-nucleoside phosphorylase|nr:thymidine phosphorylase [Candidatus Angelobacter sp.]
MRPVDLIRKKRDGAEHTREEIAALVNGYTAGSIPDYQMSAWLMAVLLKGMSRTEIALLTEIMLNSGATMDLSSIPGKKVDKHSTGGVGDKTSFILAAIVAAAGLTVPMISGRGLGHTGGTLDKLESIPGFNVNLTTDNFMSVLKSCGCALIGQTAEIAPADKKLYALRDVTGTVESPALICASIMSKKLAEGIDALVLDVKTGSGAFMKKKEDAVHLAELMVETGQQMGKRVAALITDMDQPLGRTVGNSLEILECIEIMRGEDGPLSKDLRELSVELSAWMFFLTDKCDSVDAGRNLAEEMLTSGKALDKFKQILRLQGGGDISVVDKPSRLPHAAHTTEFKSSSDGFITAMQCEQIGIASLVLGGGRSKKEDTIDHAVGLILHKKVGDAVKNGESLCTIHYNAVSDSDNRLSQALEILESSYTIAVDRPAINRPLVHQVVGGALRARGAGEISIASL